VTVETVSQERVDMERSLEQVVGSL